MSSTCSWMRQSSGALLAFGVLVTNAFADDVTALVRPNARILEIKEFLTHEDVSGIVAQIDRDLSISMPSVRDCSTLLAIPFGYEPGRDPKTDTRTIIMTSRVQCWAFTRVPATAHVAPATAQDGISPTMIEALMIYLRHKNESDEEWLKTFRADPGGEISCKDAWVCKLEWPDGENPPEQSLDFEMILAAGSRRFIEVDQLVYGRPNLVYGVEMDVSGGEAKVVSLNFTP